VCAGIADACSIPAVLGSCQLFCDCPTAATTATATTTTIPGTTLPRDCVTRGDVDLVLVLDKSGSIGNIRSARRRPPLRERIAPAAACCSPAGCCAGCGPPPG